ncbi:MAG: hypothetical protein QXS20_08895 [Candidatus Thorarchaeota archaeon]
MSVVVFCRREEAMTNPEVHYCVMEFSEEEMHWDHNPTLDIHVQRRTAYHLPGAET